MLELININKNYNPGSVNELCLFKDFNLTVKEDVYKRQRVYGNHPCR